MRKGCRKNGILMCIMICTYCLKASVMFAQWSNDLNENTEVSLFTGLPTLVSDEENGVIVFSQSRDVNPLLRAQRIDVKGNLRWPGLQGVRVSGALDAQWLRDPFGGDRFVLSDGQGGAFIAYQIGKIIGYMEEPPEPIFSSSAFLQRMDSSGNRLFGQDGLRLMPILPDTTQFYQLNTNMISDGEQGVFVLWEMSIADSFDLAGAYLTRVNNNGEVLWGPIRVLDKRETLIPYLDNNLDLNLYHLTPESTPPTSDLFLKVSSHTGEIISKKDIEIGVGQSGFNAFYDYTTSANGSAIFAFHDFRGDTLRAQKLDEDGNKVWGEEPIILADSLKGRTLFEIDSDKAGGAFLWYQSLDTVLTVLHIDASGKITWKKGFKGYHGEGISIILPARTNHRPMSVSPEGNLFILSDGFHLVNKIGRTGDISWQTRISNRADIAANIDDYAALADADGGCTVVWEEVGQFVGLRAQRVDRYGNLGGTTPVEENPRPPLPLNFILERPRPNPFNDTVKIAFSIPETSTISLKVYDILGKEVITLKQDYLSGGHHAVLWDGTDQSGRKLSSGIYLLVLRSGQVSVNQKLLLLK